MDFSRADYQRQRRLVIRERQRTMAALRGTDPQPLFEAEAPALLRDPGVDAEAELEEAEADEVAGDEVDDEEAGDNEEHAGPQHASPEHAGQHLVAQYASAQRATSEHALPNPSPSLYRTRIEKTQRLAA